MKRSGEIVLTIIGIVLSIGMCVVGIVFLYLKDSEAYLQYLNANWSESQNMKLLDMMSQSGTQWILPGIIGIVIGLLATMILKGNRNPKLAGWLLIITAIVVTCISLFGFFSAVIFIIPGIMALVRKPKRYIKA